MAEHLTKKISKIYKEHDIFINKQKLKKELVDHFPLFIKREQLSYYIAKIELIKKILNVKGSVIECGVFKGSSLLLMAKLFSIFEPYGIHRKIIGFDTFTGFPSSSDIDKKNQKDKKKYRKNYLGNVNLKNIENSIKLFNKHRLNGHISKINLVKGDAIKTIPKFIDENSQTLISLLYLDFDLYEPTKIALKYFLPRMSKGSIIAFDQLNQKRWKGETVALLKSINLNKHKLKQFNFEPNISYIEL
jgi:hypothetical protein